MVLAKSCDWTLVCSSGIANTEHKVAVNQLAEADKVDDQERLAVVSVGAVAETVIESEEQMCHLGFDNR